MEWYNDPTQITPMLATLEGLRAVQRERLLAADPPELGGRGEVLMPLVFFGTLQSDKHGELTALACGLLPADTPAPTVCTVREFRALAHAKGNMRQGAPWLRGGIYEMPEDTYRCLQCGRGWDLASIHDVHVLRMSEDLALEPYRGKTLEELDALLQQHPEAYGRLDASLGRTCVLPASGIDTEEGHACRPCDEDHVIGPDDVSVKVISHRCFHADCLRRWYEREARENLELHLAQIRMELESAGFTRILLSPMPQPEECVRELERVYAGEDAGDPMLLRAIPYAHARTAQGAFGLLLSEEGHCWIDLRPAGLTLLDLMPRETRRYDRRCSLLPLDPFGEAFHMLREKMAPHT